MKVSPIRRQYLDIKNRYPGLIIFFRLGDFYETFDDDAKLISKELEITLTSKEMGKGYRVPLSGIPYHALDNYLSRLVNRGYKVAICEQLTPPGKGLVERDVVRVVTPGTIVEPALLKDNSNNFLVSLITEGENTGMAYVDITTGEFATTQLSTAQISDEIERLQPAEVLLPDKQAPSGFSASCSISRIEDYWFELETAHTLLINHFNVINLEGYGCERLPLAIRAAGAIIHYISETQKVVLGQIKQLTTYSTESFMAIDYQTRRNLELFSSMRWGTVKGSLLSIIDSCKTSMGGRLIKKWLGQPLLDINGLTNRQNCIAFFYDSNLIRQKVIAALNGISDLERIINRIKSNIALPRELIALSLSLKKLPEIDSMVSTCEDLQKMRLAFPEFQEIIHLIQTSIVDNPNGRVEQGNIIRDGFSDDLDKLRELTSKSKKYLATLEQRERDKTGIKTLKVLYNRVFGYFIEISKSNLHLVPADYIRKQTLVNCERFFTQELKEYELSILNAQEKISTLEVNLFRQICEQIAQESDKVLLACKNIAEIDVFSSLADVAIKRNYIRPELNTGNSITIKAGRHPIVENNLTFGAFVPNDTYLNNEDTQIIILTGPNMSGKSTFLRQVAQIVLLAQVGSYIPAESATIGIVDRIFTRIGAQEDLAAGQSTFMVEMTETANILNNATSKSLIIFDEVGRGTSTFDGLSLAWAIVEYIHNSTRLKSKTLFATHYHELVELANLLPRVKNYNVLVSEEGGQVVFHRIISPGSTDKSYGIHVAKLAGIPASILHRADEILASLENNRGKEDHSRKIIPANELIKQMPLFDDSELIIKDLMSLDIDSISPLEAITKLYELKQKAKSMNQHKTK